MKWRPARYINLNAIEVLNRKRDEFDCPKKALMAARGYWYNDPNVGAVDESLCFSSRFAIENADLHAFMSKTKGEFSWERNNHGRQTGRLTFDGPHGKQLTVEGISYDECLAKANALMSVGRTYADRCAGVLKGSE